MHTNHDHRDHEEVCHHDGWDPEHNDLYYGLGVVIWSEEGDDDRIGLCEYPLLVINV